MMKSTRFITFMWSLILVHITIWMCMIIIPEHLQVVAGGGYIFLGGFGIVTGGSKIAEKWKGGDT